MKKTLILASFAIASLAVLGQSGVLDSLIAFLLVGAIPGTGYSIPSGFMLLLIATVLWLIIAKLLPLGAYIKTKRPKSKTKKSMPRRRFSQI